MFVVITHHFCKPELTATARERIDKNGELMTGHPGFVYRYRIETPDKPDMVSTFTAWKSEADFQSFREKRAAQAGHAPQTSPYDRIETQSFVVQATHSAAPV